MNWFTPQPPRAQEKQVLPREGGSSMLKPGTSPVHNPSTPLWIQPLRQNPLHPYKKQQHLNSVSPPALEGHPPFSCPPPASTLPGLLPLAPALRETRGVSIWNQVDSKMFFFLLRSPRGASLPPAPSNTCFRFLLTAAPERGQPHSWETWLPPTHSKILSVADPTRTSPHTLPKRQQKSYLIFKVFLHIKPFFESLEVHVQQVTAFPLHRGAGIKMG